MREQPRITVSERPQGLAVHLSLVPPPGRPKKEAYVGWTGMASASSLASFNAGDAGESAGTVEIDPQYAMGLGFVQGDMVCPCSCLIYVTLTRLRSKSACFTTSRMLPLLERSLYLRTIGKSLCVENASLRLLF